MHTASWLCIIKFQSSLLDIIGVLPTKAPLSFTVSKKGFHLEMVFQNRGRETFCGCANLKLVVCAFGFWFRGPEAAYEYREDKVIR